MELHPHDHNITRSKRNNRNGHSSFAIWFTGLSGSGKSTLANLLEQRLHMMGMHTYVLDGDNIRSGLNKDLDFSETGRIENIRRISEVAKLFVDAGIITITAFISPYAKDRQMAKKLIGAGSFMEVYLDCPVSVCEQRDVKELYKKARAGTIKNFTGVDALYEPPSNPDLSLRTAELSAEMCVDLLLEHITARIAQNSTEQHEE